MDLKKKPLFFVLSSISSTAHIANEIALDEADGKFKYNALAVTSTIACAVKKNKLN